MLVSSRWARIGIPDTACLSEVVIRPPRRDLSPARDRAGAPQRKATARMTARAAAKPNLYSDLVVFIVPDLPIGFRGTGFSSTCLRIVGPLCRQIKPDARLARTAGVQEVRPIAGPGKNAVARPLSQPPELSQIHAHQLALPHHYFARNEDRIDVASVHEHHDGTRSIVQRKN